MEAISREFRVAVPWELLYADDLAVIAKTEEELIKRLNEWKDNVESKGMRVTHARTHTDGLRRRNDGSLLVIGESVHVCRVQFWSCGSGSSCCTARHQGC